MPRASNSTSAKFTAPTIQATSQQTRFALSLDPTSTDIDLPGVSLTIGQREILADAHLKLNAGVHYVLIGRNGVGKSTLLRAIADKLIPGLATNLRILLLQQSYNEQPDEAEGADEKPIEYVVRSDKERMDALRKQELLQNALDNTSDPNAVVHAVRTLEHEDRIAQLELAKKTAQLRSGGRGIKARKELKALEDEISSLSLSSEQEISEQDISTSLSTAVSLLANIQAQLEASSNGPPPETLARTLLKGLGFTSTFLDQPLRSLSSGWQMRARLASLLFQPCDLLLLDEPTNFLDLPAMLWLETYLSTKIRETEEGEKRTLVFVSHDRAFAETVGEEVIVLKPDPSQTTSASMTTGAKLVSYPGSLSSYTRSIRTKHIYTSRMQSSLDRQKSHIQSSIQANLQAAARSGDDKKLKQAKSRQRKLDDRMGHQVGLTGGKFKLNRDLAGWHLKSREDVVVEDKSVLGEAGKKREGRIELPTDPESLAELRFPGALVDLDGVKVWYKGRKTYTLRDVRLTVRLRERVGIVGLNGAGKSTLVRCLVDDEQAKRLGLEKAVEDSDEGKRMVNGSVQHHPRVKIGYFSQAVVERLDDEKIVPLGMTALEWMIRGGIVEAAPGDGSMVMTEHVARGSLASLGLVGKTVSHVPIRQLSGGQKVRLALAGIVYPPPVSFSIPSPYHVPTHTYNPRPSFRFPIKSSTMSNSYCHKSHI
ncbi:P-loop containing nucleoside triphosphate hydrolase protein [Dendrothele bispora CBS 962.96]|uniref:P-loop containing nucleoside triphosphate hydrolase protein n=1 Tax=Dendrothele bispora (strain CBS 962.96) TaxID=1314807 RepID=A0A4S8LPV2_DENBC|nr:P-loop containing nucleoside triphosphate hydrolase protein [Dendrothele bispora CBS 962.96]